MTVAQKVLYSPQVSTFLAVLATTIGRDKTYRLIQYVSRILAWNYGRRGLVEAAARFNALKGALGMGRKMMRIFKPLENLRSALNISEQPLAGVPRTQKIANTTQFARQLCYAVFLTTDTLVWLQNAKFLVFDKEKAAKIGRISNKAWISGLSLSIISSIASLANLRAQARRFAVRADASRAGSSEKAPEDAAADEAERRKQGRALLAQRQQIMSQLIGDSLDIFIPANNLGITNMSEGFVGACGAVTSYMALQKVWSKQAAGVRAKSA